MPSRPEAMPSGPEACQGRRRRTVNRQVDDRTKIWTAQDGRSGTVSGGAAPSAPPAYGGQGGYGAPPGGGYGGGYGGGETLTLTLTLT